MHPPDLTRTGAQLLEGPAGTLEVFVDLPRHPPGRGAAPAGIALVAHPHPLIGGDAHHKVPAFLARALAAAGWAVLRPNFRGVGASAGTHDEGQGEADDLLALALAVLGGAAPAGAAPLPASPAPRLALVGFSFGAFVQAQVAKRLADLGRPAARVVLLGMPFGEAGGRRYEPPGGIADALVVHGELDDRVPLAAILDWARPTRQPVVVIPGADHFFSGRLALLRTLVLHHLATLA